jgi:uncharacterized Zn finger protein
MISCVASGVEALSDIAAQEGEMGAELAAALIEAVKLLLLSELTDEAQAECLRIAVSAIEQVAQMESVGELCFAEVVDVMAFLLSEVAEPALAFLAQSPAVVQMLRQETGNEIVDQAVAAIPVDA